MKEITALDIWQELTTDCDLHKRHCNKTRLVNSSGSFLWLIISGFVHQVAEGNFLGNFIIFLFGNFWLVDVIVIYWFDSVFIYGGRDRIINFCGFGGAGYKVRDKVGVFIIFERDI